MKPDRIQFAPAQSGWEILGQRIEKSYTLGSCFLMAAFTTFVTAMAEVRASSASVDLHVFGTTVLVEISRHDNGDLNDAELTLVEAIDAVFELLDVAPSSPEE